jgi:hypothetical protein
MIIRIIFIYIVSNFFSFGYASIYVGLGKTDITPPIGTPSAGFLARRGASMQTIHDPLFASALCISTQNKKIILCSVDHLGFPYSFYQEILAKVQKVTLLEEIEIYIGSTHTHSGGGAYLDIPIIGYLLSGKYNKKIHDFYINQTVDAIIQSTQNLQKAKIGIGYGVADSIIRCRKKSMIPLYDIALIKITNPEDLPIAAVFNFAVHPSILKPENLAFSADFVGCTRGYLRDLLKVESLYFNGAQAEIKALLLGKNGFESCDFFGYSLAKSIEKIWDQTDVAEFLEIETQKYIYTFYPTPYVFEHLPIPLFELYESEINLILFNKQDAFITIPGELSYTYDKYLKEFGKINGFRQVSILGLTNDAHGYILSPESWDSDSYESSVCFGGKFYGEKLMKKATSLLQSVSTKK